MKDKASEIMVDEGDAWILLLSTVRYAMGRRTYMSSVAPEMVLRYKDALTQGQVIQIRNEVDDELTRLDRIGKTLGDRCDHENWKKFVIALKDEE